MKRFNLLYFIVIPLAFIWYKMHTSIGQQSVFFYGFAENKETELSHDEDVLIYKIHVTPGQEVKKGDLLMEVTQDEIDFKLSQVKNKLNDVAFDVKKQRKDILDEISPNIKTMFLGSRTVVRNLMIDKAASIPNPRATLSPIAWIIVAATMVTRTMACKK